MNIRKSKTGNPPCIPKCAYDLEQFFLSGSLESEKIIIGSIESQKIGSLETETSGPYRSIPGT